ncbi:MAG: SGNH/GDSL hydrolase family protein [Lachnospiraceae bacterium]|nr:SGNH/GDSL hydrolase family protein [Lachnospiraceae bacterium]
MGNYEQLKQSVSDVIKTNGNQEITGSILQNVLLTIISTVGANASFVGIATPATNPGTPDGPVFYLASKNGTYTNFGGIELQDGLSVLLWNGSWSSQHIFGIDDEPTAGSDNLVKSGGVQEELALGAVYDVSAKNPTAGPNNDGKWESLSALLSDANLNTLIPTAVRKGGMSIKFVQSSDNKYVQYKLMSQSFNTNIFNWINDTEKIEELDSEINGVIINANINPTTGEVEQYNGRIISSNFYPITSQPTVGVYIGNEYYQTFLRYYDANKSIIGSSYTSESVFIKIVSSISNSSIEKEDIIGLYCTIDGVKTIFSMNDKIADIKNQSTRIEALEGAESEFDILTANTIGKRLPLYNGYIRSTDEIALYGNGVHTDYIDISNSNHVYYSGVVFGDCVSVIFYDSEKEKISTYVTDSEQLVTMKKIKKPENAVFARASGASETINKINLLLIPGEVYLPKSLEELSENIFNLTNLDAKAVRIGIKTEGFYIYKENGKILSLEDFYISNKVKVNKGDIVQYNGEVYGNAKELALYDLNGAFIEYPTLTNKKTIITHDGYIISCSQNSNDYIQINNYRIDDLHIYLTDEIKNKYIYKEDGGIQSWNESWGASYYVTDYIPILRGEEYIYNGLAEGNAASVAFYDINKNYLPDLTIQRAIFGEYRFTVPSNACYMKVSSNVQYIRQPQIYKRKDYSIDGIKWKVIGDSISVAYSQVRNKFYYDFIRYKYKDIDITLNAVAGSRIAYHTGNTTSFVQRIKEMVDSDTDKDADLITIFGGVNDWGQERTSTANAPIEIGSLDDETPLNYTEATTFIKALKYICTLLINNYPKAKIIFMTPIGANPDESVTNFARYKNSLGHTIMDYRDAMKSVANFYGVDVCDIGGECGITPYVDSQRETYFLGFSVDGLGGLHPNEYGHRKISDTLLYKLLNK